MYNGKHSVKIHKEFRSTETIKNDKTILKKVSNYWKLLT